MMRVACIGGGPAGLFLSLLLGRAGRHEIDVFDRDPENATYGFGVVLSRLAAARLRSMARDVIDDILKQSVQWQSVEVRTQATAVRSSGHGFAAVGRQHLLGVLRKHAVEAGVRIFQPCPIESTDLLDDYDIVVAADGAGSYTRKQWTACFQPSITYGTSRYAWFGVDRPFECMTFLFADGGEGMVGAHVYPYSATASTFLVETSQHVWRTAGFTDDGQRPPGWTDASALNYCQEVFSKDLAGANLIGNGSRWLTFGEVRNEHWSRPGVVLLGDAAHTAHFSVGSGTSMAMEDAAELASCLTRMTGIQDAFRAYEAARRPVVAGIQTAAWASSQFWERIGSEAGRDADDVLLRLLTRTGQTDIELLLKIDPGLATLIRRPSCQVPGGATTLAVPLSHLPRSHDGPIAVLVEPHEIKDLDGRHPGQSHWASVAVTVDWGQGARDVAHQTAAYLDELRRRIRGIPTGVFLIVRSVGLPRVSSSRAALCIAALDELATPDFVSIGCIDADPAARAIQMTLCESVRSDLGITTVYACLPAYLDHGRTHVRAARADDVWLIHGPLP